MTTLARPTAWWGWLVLALVLGVGVGWPTDARAQERFGILNLDLRTDAGDAPSHLCVVSEAEGTRTRRKLFEVLENKPADDDGRVWFATPDVWDGDEASAERLVCASEELLGNCRPRIELPPRLSSSTELWVACTKDSLYAPGAGTEPRPLFVLLEHLEGSPPSIESIRVTGGVATIGIAADLNTVEVTARSLGGHYLPDRSSQRAVLETTGTPAGEPGPARKKASLQLESRCRITPVKLPRTRLTDADRDRMSLRVHGMEFDVDRCVVGELEGAEVLQLRLPKAPLSVGSIDVGLAATGAGKAAARYGARYNGAWPEQPFPLTFKQATFEWRRPKCIYPEGECPVATLETGTRCASTLTEEGCAYTCPGTVGDDALDLELPLSVTFGKQNPRQRWTDKIAVNGQLLSSYVPSDQIYLKARFGSWQPDAPSNRIRQVIVYGENGDELAYGVAGVSELQLKVPGASCEPVRYEPRGDRKYDDDIASVADGSVEFGPPSRLAKRLTVNLTLAIGGGPAWSDAAGSGSNPPVYFNGLGMFAVRFRPRARGWNRIGFEARFGGTLGRWGETTVTEDEEDALPDPDELQVEEDGATEEFRAFGWARVMFEPGVVVAVHDRFGLGSGFGLGFSFPIREQQDLTGDRISFIWSPSLDGRFYIRPWFALMLQFRAVFGDPGFLTSASDLQSEQSPMTGEDTAPPELETDILKARSLLATFGVVASF